MNGCGVNLNSNGAYWQAFWTDAAGGKHRRGLGPKSEVSRREALKLCAELAREHAITPAKRHVRSVPTLRAWADIYLDLIRQTHAQGTVTLTEDTIDYLVRRFGEDRRLDKITPADAEDFVVWMSKTEGLREATVCRHVRTCKTIWGRAIKRRVCAESPWLDCKSTPRKVAKEVLDITDAGVSQLVEAGNSDQWRSLVALCAWAGMRRGEALRVGWQDCQWDRHRIRVRLPDGQQDADTKHAERWTLMTPELERVLRECFDRAPEGSAGPCDGMPTDNLDRDMGVLIRRAGMVPWPRPFHALRAWRVSTWKLKYPGPVVDAWLGHSEEVSDEHYFGVRDEVFGLETELEALRARIRELEQKGATA